MVSSALLSYRKIAAEVGLSESAVRKIEKTAIEKCRQEVAEHGAEIQEEALLAVLTELSIAEIRAITLAYYSGLMREGWGDEGDEPPPWL